MPLVFRSAQVAAPKPAAVPLGSQGLNITTLYSEITNGSFLIVNLPFCLFFNVVSQFNDEKRLMGFHQNLEDVTEDQLSLASIHYMRSHYQEAIDIYKRLLLQNRSQSPSFYSNSWHRVSFSPGCLEWI